MKVAYFLILLFLFACNVIGQNFPADTAASKVKVIQQKWNVKKTQISTFYSNPNEDPFRANNETNQAISDRKQNAIENRILIKQGKTAVPPLVRSRPTDINQPDEPISHYVYIAKIRNQSDKTIQKVAWEYIFFEKDTNREVGRQKFVTDVNIELGKIKNLVGQSVSPPTGSIDATLAAKKKRDQYSEQVIIQSIEYSDGSISQEGSK